jgi:bifunctional DNA-binding transcriptional regulator/antitoxin component of YhaV-PrlF toxin-antitoxin module
VTIPIGAFSDAGLRPGDTVEAQAVGPGRVVLSRQEDLLDEFSGALHARGQLRDAVQRLRDEWA